jgi:lysozyme
MRYSKRGLALTEGFEGLKLEAYWDRNGWAIGYGHRSGVVQGMTCTREQAEAWLGQDIAWAEFVVDRYVTVPVTQGEYDAMVDFCFNLGSDRFEHSTLLELVDQGKIPEAAAEFEKWDKMGGKEVAGLLRRRLAEKDEFLHG